MNALIETAPACALTTLTTATGFAVLALSTSPSLREFGLFAALGVAIALVTGLGVPLIALATNPSLDVDADTRSLIHRPTLSITPYIGTGTRRVWTLVATGVACVALAGIASWADTDLRINGALPSSHWARTEAQTVDRVIGGLVDVVFRADTGLPGGTARPRAFDALVRLQSDVASDPSVGRVFSFADAALWVGRQAGVTPDALTGSEHASPTRRARKFNRYYRAAASIAEQHDSYPLIEGNDATYVLYVRLRDTGARAWSALLDRVEERDASEPALTVSATGTVLFFATAREQVNADAWRIVGASIATSLLVLAVAFRRWRTIAGAMVVLAATGLAALAVFGALGIGVQRLHLFAFSAALGVGIDPIIHLNAAIRDAHRRGLPEPLQHAWSTCAVPIVRTWLVLTLGLTALLVSRVPEIREVGGVLIVAFAANLVATATAFTAVAAGAVSDDSKG